MTATTPHAGRRAPERASAPAGPRATVHFHSLGCPKNLLDTEVMLGTLATRGFAIAERLEDADAVVVNTCAFIESAREESIQAILDVADLREQGALRALVVTGCMPQRYGDALARELPEVDAFVGTGAFPRIAEVLGDALAGRSRGVYLDAGTHLYDHRSPRVLTGPGHTAYVKIAEGCDRVCAFCAIPAIRGRFQSRSRASLEAEVRQLGAAGVREVNLVAQDSTSWGKDLPGEGEDGGRPGLPELLRALDALEEGPDWLRLLYVYPSAVTDELLDVFSGGRRLLPYVDVPLQHASDAMLRAMRRGTTADRQWRLVERIRERIPGVTLRTTFIVGFPGETEADFEALLDFVRAARFDRLGVFRYSDEEGTAGEGLPGKVPRAVARERYRRLTELQRAIMAERLARLVGSEQTVLVDAVHPPDARGGRAEGRLASQAPEIDGGVWLRAGPERDLAPGDLRTAHIRGLRGGVDLEAEV